MHAITTFAVAPVSNDNLTVKELIDYVKRYTRIKQPGNVTGELQINPQFAGITLSDYSFTELDGCVYRYCFDIRQAILAIKKDSAIIGLYDFNKNTVDEALFNEPFLLAWNRFAEDLRMTVRCLPYQSKIRSNNSESLMISDFTGYLDALTKMPFPTASNWPINPLLVNIPLSDFRHASNGLIYSVMLTYDKLFVCLLMNCDIVAIYKLDNSHDLLAWHAVAERIGLIIRYPQKETSIVINSQFSRKH